MLPFSLSRSPWTTYWIPPAQCGLRAHAGPATARSASAASAPVSVRALKGSSSSPQAVAVDLEAERGPQELGRLPRCEHAGHEDLEVLHHVRDVGIDRELQRDVLLVLLHVEKALLDRPVHAVVDVE